MGRMLFAIGNFVVGTVNAGAPIDMSFGLTVQDFDDMNRPGFSGGHLV